MYTNCATQSIYIPEHEGCSDCEVLEQDVEELKGQMADVQETLPEKQDKLTAGEGIFITPDNIISSTSGTFVVTFSNGTADKTISQIINAFDNNMTIIGSDGTSFFPLEDIDKVSSRAVFFKMYPQLDSALVGSAVVGSSTVGGGGEEEFDWERYTVESDNSVTHDTGTLECLKHLVDGLAQHSVRGTGSIPEGSGGYYLGDCAMAIGSSTKASGNFSFAQGGGTIATGQCAVAQGAGSQAIGPYSHAEGSGTFASNSNSHAEGSATHSEGTNSHAEGALTYATGSNSHAEGYTSLASAYNAHAEGNHAEATAPAAHAEGIDTAASGDASHAEGYSSSASGKRSHAEGYSTTASGDNSHSEGYGTTATQNDAHAEGRNTDATGEQAHSEGLETGASGNHSHAGGYQSVASGTNSFAHGDHVTAQGADQTVIGSLNVTDTNNEYAFIIGNGNHGGGGSASNAFGVKWDGTLVFANGTTITPAQFANLASLVNAYGQNF